MSENELEALEQMADLMENIDGAMELFVAIGCMPFQNLTAEMWKELQEASPALCDIFMIFKQIISKSVPVLGNEALMSHLNAVIAAEQ